MNARSGARVVAFDPSPGPPDRRLAFPVQLFDIEEGGRVVFPLSAQAFNELPGFTAGGWRRVLSPDELADVDRQFIADFPTVWNESPRTLFEHPDRDQSGRLSRAEVVSNDHVQLHFEVIDSDGDDRLSKPESYSTCRRRPANESATSSTRVGVRWGRVCTESSDVVSSWYFWFELRTGGGFAFFAVSVDRSFRRTFMTASNSLRFSGLVLSAVLAVGAAGCAHEKSFGQRVDDTTITAKVKSALLADPDVSGLAINVDTLQGDVQLSGFVDSATQAQRAEDIASRVENVDEVINKLTVR